MYVIHALSALLTLNLFAASRADERDTERLQKWMRETTAAEAAAKRARLESVR